jgi:signal transduction histidine kinase
MSSALRPTLRRRLALLLVALIVATGLVLMAASYFLVHANINDFRATTGAGAAGTMRTRSGQGSNASALVPGTMRPPAPARSVQREIADHTLHRLLVQDGVILGVLSIVATLIAWLISGRMLGPLHAITRKVRRISGDRLDERLDLAGPRDELHELGRTFDAMLGRLERAFRDQRLFAAHAAHELRTPLSVMRAELDLALTEPHPTVEQLRETVSTVRRGAVKCAELSERLLVLTRGEIAASDSTPALLDELVRSRLDSAADRAAARNIVVDTDLDRAEILGDASLLDQLIENLIENAIEHNYEGGWVEVATSISGGQVLFEVTNSATDVPTGRLVGLLEPLQRRDSRRAQGRRPGLGLGLSIVRAIAEAHGGSVTLSADRPGSLSVRVQLPLLRRPPTDGSNARVSVQGR